MSKVTINGVHVDLWEIVMITALERNQGDWVFGVRWKGGDNTSLIKAYSPSPEEKYALTPKGDDEKKARAVYEKFLADWVSHS